MSVGDGHQNRKPQEDMDASLPDFGVERRVCYLIRFVGDYNVLLTKLAMETCSGIVGLYRLPKNR